MPHSQGYTTMVRSQPKSEPMQLILYSKPGCHLCEGLQEKLEAIQAELDFELEVRDITTRDDWFAAYQYEVPVLYRNSEAKVRNLLSKYLCHLFYIDSSTYYLLLITYYLTSARSLMLPRPSPRASVAQIKKMLEKYS